MRIKVLYTIIVCLSFFNVISQSNLNNFKYVIVPKKFDFLNNADQYQLNSLTKFLFEKQNFETYFNNDRFPEDLIKDRCLALTANVIKESGLFRTKVKVQLQDCRNTIVFESGIGDSKQKAYEKAYHESLREAFQSFEPVNYSYNQKSISNEGIAQGEELIKQPIKEQFPEPEKAEEIKEIKTDPKPVLPVLVTPDAPATSEITEVKSKQEQLDIDLKSKQNSPVHMLYAQTINNGFQLVDRTPKVVYTIYNSGKKDIYIVKGKDAVIYKLNDIWVISEMVNESLKTESLSIKF